MEHAVDVDIPAAMFLAPLDFDKRTAAFDALPPESTGSESGEAGIEPVDLS